MEKIITWDTPALIIKAREKAVKKLIKENEKKGTQKIKENKRKSK